MCAWAIITSLAGFERGARAKFVIADGGGTPCGSNLTPRRRKSPLHNPVCGLCVATENGAARRAIQRPKKKGAG
jgi:hypothetical protein